MLPAEQLVDAGYVGAHELLDSREKHGISLVGPTLSNHSWQAKADEGYSMASFQVDFKAQVAICPMGKKSSQWCPIETKEGLAKIHVGFRKTDCDACSVRQRCTQAKNRPRSLTLHVEPEQKALAEARAREGTEAFRSLYDLRSGIEGTFSQGAWAPRGEVSGPCQDASSERRDGLRDRPRTDRRLAQRGAPSQDPDVSLRRPRQSAS